LVKEHEKRFLLLDLFFLEGFALNFEDDFIFDLFFLFLFRLFLLLFFESFYHSVDHQKSDEQPCFDERNQEAQHWYRRRNEDHTSSRDQSFSEEDQRNF
jgi:hypothetical protein